MKLIDFLIVIMFIVIAYIFMIISMKCLAAIIIGLFCITPIVYFIDRIKNNG